MVSIAYTFNALIIWSPNAIGRNSAFCRSEFTTRLCLWAKLFDLVIENIAGYCQKGAACSGSAYSELLLQRLLYADRFRANNHGNRVVSSLGDIPQPYSSSDVKPRDRTKLFNNLFVTLHSISSRFAWSSMSHQNQERRRKWLVNFPISNASHWWDEFSKHHRVFVRDKKESYTKVFSLILQVDYR